MEEAQGSEIQGRAIMLDFIGEKSRQNNRSQGTHYILQLFLMCMSLFKVASLQIWTKMMKHSTPYVTVMDFLKDSQVLIWSVCQLSVFGPCLNGVWLLFFLLLSGGSASSSKTLLVNNLAYSATEEALQSVFEKAVAIRVPQNNGRPKGWVTSDYLCNCNLTSVWTSNNCFLECSPVSNKIILLLSTDLLL